MKILIVEDDLVQRRFLEALLTQAGQTVAVAADGEEAWASLQQDEQLRLVITDWMMPGLDGPELIRKVRAANLPHYTYLILLTSRDSKRSLLTGLEAGADDYLTKPYDREELLARLKIGERLLNLEARLQELATHDTLTGLLNRRALYDLARVELDRAAREAAPVSLVLLDLDHFKGINDQHGHLVGDQALRLAADTLRQHRRSYDQVGRWGGEEFLVLLPRTTLAEGVGVAERLRVGLAAARLVLADGQSLQVRASFGVSSTAAPPLPLDTLLHQADQALYCAKAQGRNRVCPFDAAESGQPSPIQASAPDSFASSATRTAS